MHIDTWLDRLARTAGEPRDRLIAALNTLGPDAGTVFAPLPGEAALVVAGVMSSSMTEQERAWRAAIEPTLRRLDLPVLPPMRDPARGRLDHGERFRWLHGEFTAVRRSDPGATW